MRATRVFAAVILMSLMSLAQTAASSQSEAPTRTPDVVFVPTPYQVVDVMLRLAEVDKNDIVYDLGCGDGRLVVTAAKKFGARGVGIDIDPERIKESKANAVREGVTRRVKFLQADLFTADIHEATAVTLYLLSTLNEKLRPKLVAELKPGTPIVSHDFLMGDWQPEQSEQVQGPSRMHSVYRWTVPAKAAGVWRWMQGPDRYEMKIAQHHSTVSATLRRNGAELPVTAASLRGRSLSLRLGGSEQLRAVVLDSEMKIVSGSQTVARAFRASAAVAQR